MLPFDVRATRNTLCDSKNIQQSVMLEMPNKMHRLIVDADWSLYQD